MHISLIAQPGSTCSWAEFCAAHPDGYAIALDGYVSGPTRRDPHRLLASFDHHQGADRLATRSTCAQVAIEINMGMMAAFGRDGATELKLYVNDCDQDVCLAVWLLQHHERVVGHGEPAINRLIAIEDALDATGGGYDFRSSATTLRKLAWVFAPYREARAAGDLASPSPALLTSVIEAVGARISAHVLGNGGEDYHASSYQVIGGGIDWSLVTEKGPLARLTMLADGIEAMVTHVAERAGRHTYTLARRSVWVDFDLPALYDYLNAQEGAGIDAGNCWGGSDTIGGSPRATGSRFAPAELAALINARRHSACH